MTSRFLFLLSFHFVLCPLFGLQRFSSPILQKVKQASRLFTVANEGKLLERELGAYEVLLSRKPPKSKAVALSHASSLLLNGKVEDKILLTAVAECMHRHPFLRARIRQDSSGKLIWTESSENVNSLAKKCLVTKKMKSMKEFENEWKESFDQSLNNAEFPDNGPLWRLVNIQSPKDDSAWVFCVNHGIDDQQSVNIIVKELLLTINAEKRYEKSKVTSKFPIFKEFPLNIEKVISPELPNLKTLQWTLFQTFNSLSLPAMIPDVAVAKYKKDPVKNSAYASPDNRRTFYKLFTLSPEICNKLKEISKVYSAKTGVKITITNILSAAMLCLSNVIIQKNENLDSEGHFIVENARNVNLRFLLSVGLRPFGKVNQNKNELKNDFTGGDVACTGGAVDFIVPTSSNVLDYTLDTLKLSKTQAVTFPESFRKEFWALAKLCSMKGKQIIQDWDLVPESVRLFGLGMKLVDILQAVEIDAKNSGSMGRGFTCGVSNVGIVSYNDDEMLKKNKNDIYVKESYYGTSHARNGVLCQLSSQTIKDGAFCGCLQFTSPLISDQDADKFVDSLVFILQNLS